MNTKYHTNLSQLVIGKYERFKQKKIGIICLLERPYTQIFNIYLNFTFFEVSNSGPLNPISVLRGHN